MFIEKLVSTIRVRDTLIQDIPGRAIYFSNSDPEKHNVIWVERVAMHEIRGKTSDDYSTVKLDLKSAYVLIRNCDILETDKLALSIKFNSSISTRVCEATITQNKIDGVKSGGVISVNNSGVNEAAVWIKGNIIQHNSALDKHDTIHIENCTVNMELNTVYNNTGRHILMIQDMGNSSRRHQLRDNTFWFNIAQKHSFKITVVLRGQNVDCHRNIFNNPSNTYEITAEKMSSSRMKIDCRNNWWASGILSSITQRIRDGTTLIGLPVIQYKPFLQYPPEHFGLTSEYINNNIVFGIIC